MTGFPSLQEMVQRELARRESANAGGYAPERVIIDGGPDDDAKLAAMRAKYPGKNLIVREIVDSPLRFAAVPELAAGSGPSSPAEHIDEPERADAAERAAARLARMRGLI